MAKKWTKKERRELLKEKYFESKKKFFIMIAFVLLFIVLIYNLAQGLRTGMDLHFLFLLGIAIIILIPIAIYFIDLVYFEFE